MSAANPITDPDEQLKRNQQIASDTLVRQARDIASSAGIALKITSFHLDKVLVTWINNKGEVTDQYDLLDEESSSLANY